MLTAVKKRIFLRKGLNLGPSALQHLLSHLGFVNFFLQTVVNQPDFSSKSEVYALRHKSRHENTETLIGSFTQVFLLTKKINVTLVFHIESATLHQVISNFDLITGTLLFIYYLDFLTSHNGS